MRRDLLGLGFDLLHRLDDGGAADRERARAISAHAELHLVGVAVDDLHLAYRTAEAVRDQLREGGCVALAVAVRTGEDFDRADRIDADFRGFPQAHAGAEAADRFRGRDAAGLDVAGDPDAAQLALLPGLIFARGEAGVVDRVPRRRERSAGIAGAGGREDARLIRT